jgi:hypothetical protein
VPCVPVFVFGCAGVLSRLIVCSFVNGGQIESHHAKTRANYNLSINQRVYHPPLTKNIPRPHAPNTQVDPAFVKPGFFKLKRPPAPPRAAPASGYRMIRHPGPHAPGDKGLRPMPSDGRPRPGGPAYHNSGDDFGMSARSSSYPHGLSALAADGGGCPGCPTCEVCTLFWASRGCIIESKSLSLNSALRQHETNTRTPRRSTPATTAVAWARPRPRPSPPRATAASSTAAASPARHPRCPPRPGSQRSRWSTATMSSRGCTRRRTRTSTGRPCPARTIR